MDALAPLGISATEVARAAGVSLNTVSRARMDTSNRRSPPREWRSVVRRLAEERIESLACLVAQLADA